MNRPPGCEFGAGVDILPIPKNEGSPSVTQVVPAHRNLHYMNVFVKCHLKLGKQHGLSAGWIGCWLIELLDCLFSMLQVKRSQQANRELNIENVSMWLAN